MQTADVIQAGGPVRLIPPHPDDVLPLTVSVWLTVPAKCFSARVTELQKLLVVLFLYDKRFPQTSGIQGSSGSLVTEHGPGTWVQIIFSGTGSCRVLLYWERWTTQHNHRRVWTVKKKYVYCSRVASLHLLCCSRHSEKACWKVATDKQRNITEVEKCSFSVSGEKHTSVLV